MTSWLDVVKAVQARPENQGKSLREFLPQASAEWKRVKAGLHPTKGMASLTMKGKEDFTTKKTSKVFHRKGHYEDVSAEGVKRRPYRVTAKVGKDKKRKGKKGKKAIPRLPMTEDVLIVEAAPMAGGATEELPTEDSLNKAEATTGTGSVDDADNTVTSPGLPKENDAAESQSDDKASNDVADKTEDGATQEMQGGKKRRHGKKGKKGGRKSAKKAKKAKKGGRKTAKRRASRRHGRK